MMITLCNDWEFTKQWTDPFCQGDGTFEPVRLPHTVRQLPLHYGDPESYQMVCGYRRRLEVTGDMAGKRLFLQFDGAAHIATVFVNGRELATHSCGYTAFRVEITGAVEVGTNLVDVKLDTTENPAVPPFGFVIDYLTYGGLYREVWLDVREAQHISDVYVTTPDLHTAHVEITAEGADRCRLSILELDGTCLLTRDCALTADLELPETRPWDLDNPHRYLLRCQLPGGDTQEVKFGFRTIQFDENHFYLNGRRTFLRGLNRHQCFPYVGYAAPEALQREDARILKEELGCVIVRTSHYPQSQYFIDECDKLGLLVFTELPGWQHIGDAAWKKQAVENVREMVVQYRSHPSIILWGVRINESKDDDAFYQRTNALARELDPSRPTTGVRNFENSQLLEDVYSFNDFSHTGDNPGVEKKGQVMKAKKPLLITEHNGHMFPTKAFDPWARRQEQALRHARVQDGAAADGAHAGCIGWCMFDYNTHKDFGSGDRVCYHGVLDAFRNPKLAAALYASQQETKPVLEIGSSLDIGDYPAGSVGQVYAFTNADEVHFYKNDVFVCRLGKGDWKGLPHGPLVLEDTIGDLLQTQEGYGPKKAAAIKKGLLSAAKYGLSGMPLRDKLWMLWCMARYGLKLEDGVRLFGMYIGNWGGAATQWRFDAMKNGELVASRTCAPSGKLHLEVTPSHTTLREGDTYDMAAVRIRILDEFGNIAPYAQLPVTFALEGAAELVGPAVVTAEGGMTGAYLRTIGKPGMAALTVHAEGLEPVKLEFQVG